MAGLWSPEPSSSTQPPRRVAVWGSPADGTVAQPRPPKLSQATTALLWRRRQWAQMPTKADPGSLWGTPHRGVGEKGLCWMMGRPGHRLF